MIVVFCPIARGKCQGQSKCRLWTRARIINTDSKQLASQLARFISSQDNPIQKGLELTVEEANVFWEKQGINNIRQAMAADRYLRKKVEDVEDLAAKWLLSPGFLATLTISQELLLKKADARCKPHCTSPQ